MGVFIGGLQTENFNDSVIFPPFLRTNRISLYYNSESIPIEAKCTLFMNALNPLRGLLKNANTVCFDARISRSMECCFEESSQLIEHLNALMAIFSDVNCFKFQLSLWSDERMDGYIVRCILCIPQIYYSSNVEITFFCTHHPTSLPVNAISDWLHYNYIGKERVLRINLNDIANWNDMYKRLKNVKHFTKFILIPLFRNSYHLHSLLK